MTKEELKKTIASLKQANTHYEEQIDANKSLILSYQWDLYYEDLHKKQMEIINEVLDKDIFVFIFSTAQSIEDINRREYIEPVIKGFTLDKFPDWYTNFVWIAKLKSEEFQPFDNGYPAKQFLVGLTDCYFISKSNRTDDGKYRVGYKPHDNWGVFSVDSHRINIFNRENFRDEEVLDYLKQLTNIVI